MEKPQIDLTGAKVLLVDDTPENLKLLRQALEPEGYNILIATNGEAALRVARNAHPDLILLDVQMPGMDGFETCRYLKGDGVTQDIPVIFVTAMAETRSVVQGFQAGGVDYIVKPFQNEEVLVRVQTHLKVDRLTREVQIAQQRLIDQMEAQLQTAHDMQMRLMPTASPQIPGLDIAGRCIPANHVGGDFFQYFDRNGKLAVCLADVTGKAMEAAIPVVMFSGILDSQMELGGSIEDLLGRLNRSLYRNLDSRTFVCFALGEIDLASHAFRFSDAGFPYPYHYRATEDAMAELQMDAYPLGVQSDAHYRTMETQFQTGDRIVFCSDGIVEAEDAKGEPFGFDRTANAVRKACAADLTADATVTQILATVEAFRGNAPQSDDMTCVVLRIE